MFYLSWDFWKEGSLWGQVGLWGTDPELSTQLNLDCAGVSLVGKFLNHRLRRALRMVTVERKAENTGI